MHVYVYGTVQLLVLVLSLIATVMTDRVHVMGLRDSRPILTKST